MVPFKYTASLRDSSYKKGDRPQVVYVRLGNARGTTAVFASTAPAGKSDGSDWRYEKKDGAWHWSLADPDSPIESISLKPTGSQRVTIEVRGGAKMTDTELAASPTKGPSVPPSPKMDIFSIETGIGWGSDLRISPPCTVVVGGCQRSANGGLNCHPTGWKGADIGQKLP